MYFPFLELQKWRKRSAEIRRRNCAVLPYTTSVGADTLDECLMASKPMERILANIEPTVDILKIIRPVYNFKPLCRRIPIPTGGSKAESGQNIREHPTRGDNSEKRCPRSPQTHGKRQPPKWQKACTSDDQAGPGRRRMILPGSSTGIHRRDVRCCPGFSVQNFLSSKDRMPIDIYSLLR